MVSIFKKGDQMEHRFTVSSNDFPHFQGKNVHPVCSTYRLVKEIEWSTRLFVLDMLDEDEEGVGTMVHIEHQSAAFENEEVLIESIFEEQNGNEVICSFRCLDSQTGRLIAEGSTGQKILKKDQFKTLFSRN